MLQLLKAIPLTLIITGCANGIPDMTSDKPEEVVRRTVKMFIGVPLLAGLEGSYVILDNRWAVTVAHNEAILRAQFKEAYYHPNCDIALFRHDSDELPKVGLVHENKPIYHSGYPMALPLAYSEGVYSGEVNMQDRPGCVQSVTTGHIMSGMSGGGAWNEAGELVGVNVGFVQSYITWANGDKQESPGVFQSLYGVKDWLQEVTGNDYFDGR